MSWSALTADDVLSGLNNAEKSAYTTKLLADGQTDPIDEIIDQVTAELRGAIRTCGKVELDTVAGTLPPDIHYHAIALVRYRLQTRYTISITEDRRREWQEANSFKRDLANCRYLPEAPDDDPESAAPKSKPRITTPTLTHERTDADGI